MTKLNYIVAALLLVGATTSCNRETVMPELERPTRPDTDEDLLKDSVYHYTYGFCRIGLPMCAVIPGNIARQRPYWKR